MDRKFRGLAANVLLVLNVFILFLLLFENRLVIPAWLQVFGRMHPLLLHFPLVLLVVAMALEFFRFPNRHTTGEFYETFTTYLLIAGAVLAGVTVVMGLFLSREEGYEGDVLAWHKWSGVGVMVFSSVVFFARRTSWYNRLVARLSAIVILLLLVVAGHFGAVLTHGEDFLFAPVMKAQAREPVALEDAQVFRDLVLPILEGKCTSCHNPSKSKGKLVLADSASIMKGGKTGKLLIAGDALASLLWQRIHLPEGDKKRMPPVGKPQLTDEEIAILAAWINEGLPFSKKMIALKETDTLRILGAPRFSSAAVVSWSFPEADPAMVSKLNNDYRVITPVAAGSPALNINIFNAPSYSSKVLEELLPLKEQVVAIDLAKMPVQDKDLEPIAKFIHLQTLNLNFTTITGAGLKQLAGLAELNSLALAGTTIGIADLETLKPIKTLKHLSIWNTSVTPEQIARYRTANPQIEVNAGAGDNGQLLKLNLPQLENKVNVISGPVVLELSHPVKGVQLRYTTDGSRPDSNSSTVYEEGKVKVSDNTTFRIRAFKEGWIGSEELSVSFYKSRFRPDSTALLTQPYEIHKANGVTTLFDQVLGNTANYYSGTWIGFSRTNAEILMKFNQPAAVNRIAFNTFKAPYREFFAPVEMQVWGGSSPGTLKLVKTVKFVPKEKDRQVELLETLLSGESFHYLKLVIIPMMELPADLAKDKKGLYPVMLIDEILMN